MTTLNTVIEARHRPRQNIARPTFPTDKVTRLNGQRKASPLALHTAATLNLDGLGRPLKYRSAKSGPNTLHWLQAEGEEIQRLLDTATIRAIHAADQPDERSGGNTHTTTRKLKRKKLAMALQLIVFAAPPGVIVSFILALQQRAQPLCR